MLQPHLQGPTLTLRPLVASDFDALHAVASDPLIWAQHPSRNRHERAVFEPWFTEALASRGALVVVDTASGAVLGSSRYYDWHADERSLAIGFTFLARSHWGGATNAELKRLMLDHAFQHADVVWFHVAPGNLRSQRALEKIGASFSHGGLKQLSGAASEYLFYAVRRPLLTAP
jgi:RimJ/RimL family protein N-acetyltransferase